MAVLSICDRQHEASVISKGRSCDVVALSVDVSDVNKEQEGTQR